MSTETVEKSPLQQEFDKENEELGQCFFRLGRAQHQLELQRGIVGECEIQARNQNKKCLDVYAKLQKEFSAKQTEIKLAPPPAEPAPLEGLESANVVN